MVEMKKKDRTIQLKEIALDVKSDKPLPETIGRYPLVNCETFPLVQLRPEEPVGS